MEQYKVVMPGRLPGMNDIIAANRKHWAVAVKMKHDAETPLILLFNRYRGKFNKVSLLIQFYEPNEKRDVDNVTGGGQKFILDAMQQAGAISNDNRKHIGSITHEVYTDRDNPRVEITIIDREIYKEPITDTKLDGERNGGEFLLR